MIPKIVADYVRLSLTNDVRELLDDPHGVFGEGEWRMPPSEIIAHMQNLDAIAELVDLHLSEMIAAGGSSFEFTRLMDIIMKARAA